ncbi:hypothetical protein E4U43_002723 [Claviceps pusilla]|uniref:Uncharacterized protein n=1 Tax=Claviceps pusilla TaxID=123648 RepID=A0A9P7SVX5_9HYPO|nr:hypothetical protein E4U43_002723 [Claviceps pusilla]
MESMEYMDWIKMEIMESIGILPPPRLAKVAGAGAGADADAGAGAGAGAAIPAGPGTCSHAVSMCPDATTHTSTQAPT